jgi:hypothetical protein
MLRMEISSIAGMALGSTGRPAVAGNPHGRRSSTSIQATGLALCAVLLAACGGGAGGNSGSTPVANATYTVGGTVSGLSGSLVLENNGAGDTMVASSGAFTIGTGLAQGTTYNITVATQPTGQSCVVKSGSGTLGTADVTNVVVNCATTALVQGVVAAGGPVAGATVTLRDSNNASVSTTSSSDGGYQINVTNLAAPFLLSASSNGQVLYGFAASSDVVANLNQYTTFILQAYFSSVGTTADAVFGSSIDASNSPELPQLTLFTSAVWVNLMPYLTNAGVAAPGAFNPFTSIFTANHTGFDQVLDRTVLSSNALTLSVDNGSGTTPGATSTSIAVSPGGPSSNSSWIPAADLTTLTVSQSGGSVTTTTVDTCKAHGKPIPNTGLFDCVATMQVVPGAINIAAGANFILEENTFIQTQVHPTLMVYDSDNNLTTVPN